MKTVVLLLLTLHQVYSNQPLFSVETEGYFEEIPIEVIQQKIIIPVTIQGNTYRFLLDTGSSHSIISKELFTTIQTEIVGETFSVSDANNNVQELDLVSFESLQIGQTVWKNVQTLVFDINANTNPLRCFNIDGLIGSSLLQKSILQINREENKIVLTDNEDCLELDELPFQKLELIGGNKMPYVWVNFNETKGGRDLVLVDTGAQGLYDLAFENYTQLESEKVFQIFGKSEGAFLIGFFSDVSLEEHFRVYVPQMQIGNLNVKGTVTTTTHSPDSRIGAGLLKYGVMTMNYKEQKFYFQAKKAIVNLDPRLSGLRTTLKDNKIVVGLVWDEALKNQLQFGDEVLEIDGIKMADIPYCDFFLKGKNTIEKEYIDFKIKLRNGSIVNHQVPTKLVSQLLNTIN